MKRCLAVLLLLPAIAAAQDFPKATGRINDFANVIDPAVEAELNQQIDQLEQKTSSEIAVVTVASLDGISVEEYANKLFKAWGVGQAKQDNGVLVLVAPKEHEMRIEVGYGLEGVLPDGLAGDVIRSQFTPKFRNNDYSGGIRDGVTRLIAIVEKHQVLTPEELASFNASNGEDDGLPTWAVVAIAGCFVAIGFGMLGAHIPVMDIFQMLFGAMLGIIPLVVALIFAPGLSFMTLVPLAFLSVFVGRVFSKSIVTPESDTGTSASSSSSRRKSSKSISTSSSSSSSSSGSSSSSSSFGGGSSGGGGASGKW